MKLILSPASFFVAFLLFSRQCRAQTEVTKPLLQKVIDRFVKHEHYTYQYTIESVNHRTDGLPSDNKAAFLPGKEMLVVAVPGKKPDSLFARMLITKHFGKKLAYDEHQFQQVDYEPGLEIYYALVQVIFPAEANAYNCSVNLQVFDKKHPAEKVWLLVFEK
ncbi:MAG TPA: hypothetical protein VHB48_17530 [Chitinophagaceae bacterium]|nr:hypothetical protein [Chitinophagaceae bacterium]